ncbi:MAG TPA: menaquinone biosynthesis protein [Planctomycetaceae bacterium]|nr:menaquinone biosynthesis protein [Planctomycetaceae bacterium]
MFDSFHALVEPLRVGVVSYLNSKPLFEDLAELLPDADIRLDYPSRLADQLAAGELDVALIPSVEYFRGQHRNYEIVSDACVAARGPVLSVKLYSRVPPGKIRTLALDEGSRTSATLARVLLVERYGVEPQLEPLPMQCTTQDTLADAVLLIGDRAMFPPEEQFPVTWDLGQEWFEWTGLPFVFAMWVARPGLDLEPVETALSEARNRGESRLVEIAHREAPTLTLPVSTAVQYLTLNLHYRLAAAERTGLRLFHQLAARNGLAPEGVDLVFSDVARAG